MKFWRLSLLQKSSILIGVSIVSLAISYGVHFCTHREIMLNSAMSIIGSVYIPFQLLLVATEGLLTCPADERRPDQLVKLWAAWSVFMVMLALAIYLGAVPTRGSLLVVPLTGPLLMLPWVLWQRQRIRRCHARLDSISEISSFDS